MTDLEAFREVFKSKGVPYSEWRTLGVGIFDDDDLELDGFGIDPLYGKMTLGMRLAYFLMLVGVVAMVGYLILIIVFPDQFSPRDWIGSAAPEAGSERVRLKGFQLGGVYLGVTPDEVRRDYPSLRLEPNPNAGLNDKTHQFGRFFYHEGEYQISFLGPKDGFLGKERRFPGGSFPF